MYRIIGADEKEYGPITADQIRQWLAEGRLNAQSRVMAEGSTEWRTLADFPELMPPPSVAAPPAPMAPLPGTMLVSSAEQQVNGPATGLIVLGVIEAAFSLLGLLANLLMGGVMMAGSRGNEQFARMFSGGLGIASSGLGLLIGILIVVGAMKMKKLESYSLAVTISIISILPCSLCCIAGVPIGIWSLVVLSKPEVKGAFKS
jgi:hypothetical protein